MPDAMITTDNHTVTAERRTALLAEAGRLRTRLAEIGVELGAPTHTVTAEHRSNNTVVIRGVVPAFETNPKGLLFDSLGEALAVAAAILRVAA